MSAANVAVWGVVGAAMGAYDGYKYAKKKKLKGAKKAAAIVGGALLGAVNPGKVVKAASKAVKYTKKAVKAAKAKKAAKKASKAAKTTKAKNTKAITTAKKVTTSNKKTKTTTAVAKKASTNNSKCFVAGTKIHTEKGFKNIEAIEVGDYVWSEDPETKEKALKSVKKIFVREKDSIIRLTVNGEVIETTHEHPFYVEGQGFKAAGDLKAGDELRLESREEAFVETIEEIQLDQPIKVYNFEVEDFHTYYVSGQKVLVHNTCAVNSSKATNNVLALDAPIGKNPWKEGSKIHSTILENDIIVNMAISNKGEYGRWATFDDITSVDYVRNVLAVTPEFKEKINYVQKIKIPKGTRVQIGIVGPQTYNGRMYIGGGTQIEITKRTILEPIGEPIRIY